MAEQCRQCGAPILAQQRFCRFCGTPTKWLSPDQVQTQPIPPTEPCASPPTQPAYIAPEPPPPYTTAPLESPRTSRRSWIMGLLSGFVLTGLMLLGYSAYRYLNQRPPLDVITLSNPESPGPGDAPSASEPPGEVPVQPSPPKAPPPTPEPPGEVPVPPSPPLPPKAPSLSQSPAHDHPQEVEKSPQRVSSLQLYAHAIRRVAPEYPLMARRLRGIPPVEVEIVVDQNGDVVSAKVLSGPAPLHQAALEAARQWKFQPFLDNGEPIPVTGVLVFGKRARVVDRLLQEQ